MSVFFFSLSLHLGLVSLQFLWYSFPLACCRAYPAVSIRWSGNGTGVHHAHVHPKPGTDLQVNSVLFFANWLAVNFFYFPNWEFFQNELIQFFNSFFSSSVLPPSLASIPGVTPRVGCTAIQPA